MKYRVLLASILAGAGSAEAQTALPAPAGLRFHQDVAWSPDGAWIAYSEYAPRDSEGGYDPADWSIRIVGTGTDAAEPRTLIENAKWVSWSPDGRRLAFASARDGAKEDVWTVARDGSDLRRLTTHPGRDSQPAWSPRGDVIAFASDRAGEGTHDLYLVRTDGTDLRCLTTDPASDECPAWSPDGEHLVFYRVIEGGRDQVVMLSPADGRETAVTRDQALNIFPSFVPGAAGRSGGVAFSRKVGESTGIVLLAPWPPVEPGPEPVRTDPLGGAPAFLARWSPDGTRIAFIAGQWPRSAIYIALAGDPARAVKLVN